MAKKKVDKKNTKSNGQSSDSVEEVKNLETNETEAGADTDGSVDEQEEINLEQELGEAKDKYLRLYSEFENFRRRTAKEKIELIGTANKDLMIDILPVLDDFDRAMAAEEDDSEAFNKGMSLIHHKLNHILENRGLKKMEVKKGDKFDEEIHEAITQIPSEDELEGKIVDIVEPGFLLGEKVIRFAKVVVGAKQ
jgi:molecular chaperone GrpE